MEVDQEEEKAGFPGFEDPRRLVAEVYRQVDELRQQGRAASRVYMHQEEYRILKWYRNFLGKSDSSVPDYLGEYEVFGLAVFVAGERGKVRVE